MSPRLTGITLLSGGGVSALPTAHREASGVRTHRGWGSGE